MKTLHVGSSVHEVIVHRGDEMEQLALEELELMHQLPKHYLVLEHQTIPYTHVVYFILVFLRVCIRACLFEQIWLSDVIISLFQDEFIVFDLHQQFEHSIVFSRYRQFIDDNLDRPLTVIIDLDVVQAISCSSFSRRSSPCLLKVHVHALHYGTLVQITQRSLKQFTESLLEIPIDHIELIGDAMLIGVNPLEQIGDEFLHRDSLQEIDFMKQADLIL